MASQSFAGDRPILMAHYMPWYATKESSGHWGWHWTMNKFDPDNKRPDGRREIASHDYPLIDLYDSGDPHALECQVQQMKLAGIDGVIVDWYGIKKFYDYATIHQNTLRLIEFLKRAGLRFAICYEDQSVKHMVSGNELSESEAVAHGRDVFKWMQSRWFRDNAYLKLDGRPLLLVFGPQHFEPPQWEEILSELSPRPHLHVLPHLASKVKGAGKFGWPPVTGGKEISRKKWAQSLDNLYSGASGRQKVVGVAFPGFHDIYQEAELHDSYGFIAEFGGKTFTQTLDRALSSGVQVVQIATWNDYGEGTVIEPTRRRGYQFLQEIQKRRRPSGAEGERFNAEDLKLPAHLYAKRKRAAGNPKAAGMADKASDLLLRGHTTAARSLLEKIAE